MVLAARDAASHVIPAPAGIPGARQTRAFSLTL
jgi:hypothetical protein